MPAHDLQQLEHAPLPSFTDNCHSIRLLALEPSHDSSAEIRCSIFPVNLLDNPNYKALSYVWGEPSTTVPIIVDKKRYDVTPNCHAALRRLRAAGESPLWVDSICINQKDNAEKSTQIPLMGDIYSQAREVIIFLGHNESEPPHDCAARETIALHFLRELSISVTDKNILTSDDYILKIRMSGESPEFRWSALKDIFNHKWFKRLWVHQEAVLATHCTVFLNHETIPYWDLIVLGNILKGKLNQVLQAQQLPQDRTYLEFRGLLQKVQVRAWPTLRKRQLQYTSGPSPDDPLEASSLLRDLRATTYFECFDPRDRVYAIMGIAKQSEELKRIRVDYEKSVAQVYTNVAGAIIESSNSLEVIFGAGRTPAATKGRPNNRSGGMSMQDESDPKLSTSKLETLLGVRTSKGIDQEDFPSWVIDWRMKPNEEPLVGLYTHLYNAAAGTKTQFSLTNNGTGLDIKGLSIDSVLGSGEPYDLADGDVRRTALGLRLWKKHFNLYPTGCSPEFAWIRTVTVDVDGSSNPRARQSHGVRAQFDALHHLEEKGVDEITGETIRDETIERVFPHDGRNMNERIQWITSMVQVWGASIINGIFRRTFFITNSGYMGMASNPVMKGDMICIVAGCNVPLVIREESADHVLIGECFVWGLMDAEYGEVLSNMEKQDVWESFRLR